MCCTNARHISDQSTLNVATFPFCIQEQGPYEDEKWSLVKFVWFSLLLCLHEEKTVSMIYLMDSNQRLSLEDSIKLYLYTKYFCKSSLISQCYDNGKKENEKHAEQMKMMGPRARWQWEPSMLNIQVGDILYGWVMLYMCVLVLTYNYYKESSVCCKLFIIQCDKYVFSTVCNYNIYKCYFFRDYNAYSSATHKEYKKAKNQSK